MIHSHGQIPTPTFHTKLNNNIILISIPAVLYIAIILWSQLGLFYLKQDHALFCACMVAD